jgi:ribonucleoside-diphosphate reductase alpha chain
MKIKKIETTLGLIPTYDIEVPEVHHYNCEGLVSHNSSLTGSGSTNGIEPPRSAIGIKDSSTNTLKFAIPDVDKVEYEYAWSFSSNEAYLNTVAVIQKFFDQSISANTYYNPLLYPDSKVPLQVVLDDLLYAYSIGLKSLYYHNTHDMSDNGLSSSSCSSGACAL